MPTLPTNFRDVGGAVTADGRTVRTGRLFRSDFLVPGPDVDELLSSLGVRAVVDLRTPMEQELMGRYVFDDGLRLVERPILDGAMIREQAHAGTLDLETMYRSIVFEHADELAGVVALVATGAHLPAVVACTGGKDRTGLLVALVLSSLGVDDEPVLADYARSMESTALLRERVLAHFVADDLPPIPPAAFAVEPSAVRAVLAEVRSRYGSVADYLVASGAPADVGEQLRAALLD